MLCTIPDPAFLRSFETGNMGLANQEVDKLVTYIKEIELVCSKLFDNIGNILPHQLYLKFKTGIGIFVRPNQA